MSKRSGMFWDVVEGRAPVHSAARLLGWKFVDVDFEAGVLRSSFEATQSFLNPGGTVHGGVLCAMLDEAMGPTAAALQSENIYALTLEMNVNFLNAGKVGAIFAESRIVRKGREVVFLEGKLSDGAGRIIATATAIAKIVHLSS